MNQVFLVILTNHTKIIKLVECFNYEFDDYNCFMPEGKPIYFINEEEGRQWLKDNIDPKYLETEEWNSHHQFLKNKAETVEVPVSLLKKVSYLLYDTTRFYDDQISEFKEIKEILKKVEVQC